MKQRTGKNSLTGRSLYVVFLCCALLLAAVIYLAIRHGGNDLHSFSETTRELSDDWTITDSAGNARTVDLPETISYGTDGRYTLTYTLPEVGGALVSPTLCFYSNYVDVSIALDGAQLYAFPKTPAAFSGATGNTYHFVHLPADYVGKTLAVEIRCQLGSDITYLLNPPLFGSKATMLHRDVMRSMPGLTLAGCLAILAIVLGILYATFRKRLELNRATLYTTLFTLLFSVYLYFETDFAQLLMPNGYLLCFATLMLLALVPIPLIGIFLDVVSSRFRPVMHGFMMLCSVNLIGQMILNFAGVMSVRAMLPATHTVIVLSIAGATLCLFLSDRAEKPGARRTLLSAIPMVVGGIADITLLNLNQPSFNNCFWFAIGVTIFIACQLLGFVSKYFALYRTSLEAKLLKDMAYRDALAGIGNRNAYEHCLMELSREASFDGLCCIVIDINDLKHINDTLGHQAGDTAISEVGAILRACMPACAASFRTGGDEFVVLLTEYNAARTKELTQRIVKEAAQRSKRSGVPICLAIGSGQYDSADGNLLDFIRRVDTLMYECKRKQKSGRGGSFPGVAPCTDERSTCE